MVKYRKADGAVLYTKDADGNRSSMNLLGISANVIATSRGTGNSESWYLYNKDIRESTTSIIGTNGTAVATYEYDDFGNTMVTSGSNFDNEICYTGQIYDRSSGLYYYNARYYDPENARFLTQDTYRGENDQPDTLHLYAYCKNNPINYTDPTGHFAFAIPIIGGVVISAEVIETASLIGGILAAGGVVYAKYKYYKKNFKGNKYRIKFEVDKPDRYEGKSGISAMRARWKGLKGSRRSKLKKFAQRKNHRWRYHIHARVMKNGKTIRRVLII